MSVTPISIIQHNDSSLLIGIGEGESLVVEHQNEFDLIDSFLEKNKGNYIFTALSYNLKNCIEKLDSNNPNSTKSPFAILWKPASVYLVKNGEVRLKTGSNDYSTEILEILKELNAKQGSYDLNLKARTSKEEYLKKVVALQNEIQLGNIYEVNYCQEYFAENTTLEDTLKVFSKWRSITKAPYASYLNFKDWVIISGSPEMYIKKEGDKLASSPIKGTRPRGTSFEEDEKLKKELRHDPKEIAENVMIVDLVRNDLSRIAEKNSVKVDELFGIYTFETVHQMISTISCEVSSTIKFIDILKATFPMGSMTGAPKISAMKLIEKHEDFDRGFYSGSLGYIDPKGDFDLNVLIRSLIYNKQEKVLSCSVGGAITINALPENEYEECNVKIQGIIQRMRE